MDDADWFSAKTSTFGDRVAGAREALGLSQAELARRLGIKAKTLRDWENDVSEPRANKLQMLSGVLAVSIMWLLNGEGDGVSEPKSEGLGDDTVRELLGEIQVLRAELEATQSRLARMEERLSGGLKG